MTNSKLAVIRDAKHALHALKNKVPCGIRSIDDETDRKIESLTQFIRTYESNKTQSKETLNHAET